MLTAKCDKCINVRYDETPRCILGKWEGIDTNKKEYDHKWDDCKKFYPNPEIFEGLIHILSCIPDTWVPSILNYIVHHGYRNKVFAGPDGATKLIEKTSKSYLEVQRILKMTEESESYKKFYGKKEKESGFKLKRRNKGNIIKLRRRR